MKSAAGSLLLATLAAVLLCLAVAATAPAAAASDAAAPDATDYWIKFLPSYRYVETSGFKGRVGEYDDYRNSGGDFLVHWNDRARAARLDYRGTFMGPDEYDMGGKLRLGRVFTLGADARSLVRHLDKTLLGTNWSPDDIARTDGISDTGLFGVKKTSMSANARLDLPNLPVSVFARGGLQSRHGIAQLRYYDMGGDPSCGSCHSASRYQSVHYDSQNLTTGLELRPAHATITVEHTARVGRNRIGAPVDYYGSTLSSPDDELPAGVADTPAGDYAHNLAPGHRTDSNALRLHTPVVADLTFDGSVEGGQGRNSFTRFHQDFLNSDATLAWRPARPVDLTLDYHQQYQINEFTPAFALYGNPSYHRLWAGLRAERDLTTRLTAEAYYRFTRVSRSDADLWPQFYSPDNSDPLRVVPLTKSHVVGAAVTLHEAARWRVRGGYEWTDTQDPGYVTEPGTAHRLTLSASATPMDRLSVAEDFSATLQSRFPAIGRKNQLFLSTTSATYRPRPDWSLGLAYAIGAARLKSDLIYGTDPVYTESLVPYDATDQSIQATSSWAVAKQLTWDVDLRYVLSQSEFKPSPSAAPADTLPLYSPVSWAAAFSRVDVPQTSAATTLAYHWPMGFETGARGGYASYRDAEHPERTAYLRSFSLFAGRSW